MIDQIKEHVEKVKQFTAKTEDELEQFRIEYLGKKGILNAFFAEFKTIPNENKKDFGQAINELKQTTNQKIEDLKASFKAQLDEKGIYGDLSRPAEVIEIGSRHPISVVTQHVTCRTLFLFRPILKIFCCEHILQVFK